jgi:hypothetical protein
MQLRQSRPLPPRQPLRLSDAGDAQPAWIGVLNIEHYNLAMLRIATINEAKGRASVFIARLVRGPDRSRLQGIGHGRSAGTTVFEMLVLSSLAFLGLVAFLRCVEVSIERLRGRRAYRQAAGRNAELMSELADVLAMTSRAEESAAMLSGRWQPFQKMLSVAGSVGVLASLVFGADIGVLAHGVGAPLYAAIGTGAGAVAAALTGLYQYRRLWEATPAS